MGNEEKFCGKEFLWGSLPSLDLEAILLLTVYKAYLTFLNAASKKPIDRTRSLLPKRPSNQAPPIAGSCCRLCWSEMQDFTRNPVRAYLVSFRPIIPAKIFMNLDSIILRISLPSWFCVIHKFDKPAFSVSLSKLLIKTLDRGMALESIPQPCPRCRHWQYSVDTLVVQHLTTMLAMLPLVLKGETASVTRIAIFCSFRTQLSTLSSYRSASRSVVSDSLRPHGVWPARLLCPWDSPGKITGLDCHSLLQSF